MVSNTVTFRAGLKSSASDLLADCEMTCSQTEEALVALVGLLADYREEGIQLFPRVLICDELPHVLRLVQGSTAIRLGGGPKGAGTATTALKKAAPLAHSGWSVWIEREGENFGYGVFREPVVPTAIDLRTTMLNLEANACHAMLAAQVGPAAVEIVTPGPHSLHIHLSGIRNDMASTVEEQEKLAGWFVEDIPDDRLREACGSFATTSLHDQLRKGHGALVAVVAGAEPVPDELLSDAIVLENPIDLADLIERHSEHQSSEALAELLAYGSLLGGMLQSDGVTVLDTAGRLLAFNSFVKTDTGSLGPRDLVGGARHRAFHLLTRLVDESRLRGAFVRSSNGNDRAHERGSVDAE